MTSSISQFLRVSNAVPIIYTPMTSLSKNKDWYASPAELKSELKVPATFLIAGMSASGKTTAAKKLIHLLPRRYDKIIVFSQTAHMTGSWDDVADPRNIFPEPNYPLIEAIKRKQAEWIQEGRDYQICLIFDDCVGVLNTQEASHPMNHLVTMSRHFNLSLFFLVQSMPNISPTIRKNAHFVCVTKVHGSDYDMLFSIQTHYDTKKECLAMLKAYMKEYNLIVFNISNCYSERPIMVLSGKNKLVKKKKQTSGEGSSTSTDPQTPLESAEPATSPP